MRRFEVRMTTRLDVIPQAAWDYLMSHDEWRRPFVPSVTKLTDGDIDVGAASRTTSGAAGEPERPSTS